MHETGPILEITYTQTGIPLNSQSFDNTRRFFLTILLPCKMYVVVPNYTLTRDIQLEARGRY